MELAQGDLSGTATEAQLQIKDPGVATTVKTIAEEIKRDPSYHRISRETATLDKAC